MSENDKYSVSDLINTVVDHQPLEFAQVFNDLTFSKLHSAINDKKLEIAQRMFQPDTNEDEDDSEE